MDRYSREQIRAITAKISLGESILGSWLEEVIVDDYSKLGLSQLEIAQMYILPNNHGYSEDVARNAVSYVIKNTNLLTETEKRKLCHFHLISGVNKSVVNRGYKCWSLHEKNRANELCLNTEFRRRNGIPDYNKIKQALNKEFHNGENVRTKTAVKSFLYR